MLLLDTAHVDRQMQGRENETAEEALNTDNTASRRGSALTQTENV